MAIQTEIKAKLDAIRKPLSETGISAVRLKGVDWFSWITAGGSNVVILTAETGIAEALVTPRGAWILTDTIEAERLRTEEIPRDFEIWQRPWEKPSIIHDFIREQAGAGKIASDRPGPGEIPLPVAIVAAKRRLLPESTGSDEMNRYRKLGLDSAEAMTETLLAARPEWTEWDLAAEGSRALWRRGIHPTLTLVAGENRVERLRHPTPSAARLGRKAMLVFCARRHGLYANLTRFVFFDHPTEEERRAFRNCHQVESEAFKASIPGARLNECYERIASAYAAIGSPQEIFKHHQGGTTGYLSREIVATPQTHEVIEEQTALAWNPSLPGAKVEDTVVTSRHGIEVLTRDPAWPEIEINGRPRPDLLVRP